MKHQKASRDDGEQLRNAVKKPEEYLADQQYGDDAASVRSRQLSQSNRLPRPPAPQFQQGNLFAGNTQSDLEGSQGTGRGSTSTAIGTQLSSKHEELRVRQQNRTSEENKESERRNFP